MSMEHAEIAFQSPYIALLIGTAVSLDVIALTFCSPHVYLSHRSTWIRWAKYNAGWHAGLLLTYLIFIDLLSVAVQYVGVFISFPLPSWLEWVAPVWIWVAEKFRSHIVVYAAIGAMAYVWYQYSIKVCAVPTKPEVEESPFFLRRVFSRRAIELRDTDSIWFWHLSACLVAVDMLALAAVVKSGEKLVQFPQGFDRFEGRLEDLNSKILASFDLQFFLATLTITVAVFLVVGLLCFASARISKTFWTNLAEERTSHHKTLSANFIVVALKLLEPLIIFYFIIHSMAFLATGVPLHSPAFILGSGFLVAALIQFVGFNRIVEASEKQVSANIMQAGRDHDA